MTTKTLFRVICRDADGARSLSNPDSGLQADRLYDVVADVKDAVTARCPDGGSSGYVLRDSDSGRVLPQVYARHRFVREHEQLQVQAPYQAEAVRLKAGDTVVCIDAVGARSFSRPETMLETDAEYVITADVTDATTVRKPDGGSSGFMVKRAEDDMHLAGVWRRSRFAAA
jgi:hypothetical protein